MTVSPGWTCVAVASAVWLLTCVSVLRAGRSANGSWWSAALALGAACAVAAGAAGLQASSTVQLSLPAFGPSAILLKLDSLSGWFTIVLGLAALPVILYTRSYMAHMSSRVDMRLFWAALAILFLSMVMVILSANVITFLVAWELMSLSSFLLVMTDHGQSSVRQAAVLYLGATRIGTAFLMAGMLWAAHLCGSWEFSCWGLGGLRALAPGLLILLGLCVKAGAWPFHLWLPAAHPVAPAPVSALMSGVMVKVAVYMIVRLYVVSPAFSHPAFGYLLAALGAVSAFWGVLFALLQSDLKRLLAYSTVENIGLILLGIGMGLIASAGGLPVIAAVAFAAALFHSLNHSLFKSLLFLGAGAVDAAAGTRDIEKLGGLGRRMTTTFACFIAGSAAICALPPFNGFASEWLLYRAALGAASIHPAAPIRFLAMLMIGWIALVGALALGCFVRAIGVAFQGRPRSHAAERAHEVSASMAAAQITLAVFCALLGIATPYTLRVIAGIVSPDVPVPAVAGMWTPTLFNSVLVLALTASAIMLWIRSAEKRLPSRSYITWDCGFGDLTPRMQVSGASFSQPVARMFGMLYRYAVTREIAGQDRRLFPDEIVVEPVSVSYLESNFYSPTVRFVHRLGGLVQRLQAGSIHLYLLTMFGTLVLLLFLVRWVH